MSLYDNPLPVADYPAYLALRDDMLATALPYLGLAQERQKQLQRWANDSKYLSDVERSAATALLGKHPCRLQYIGRSENNRWRWAWDDPADYYPPEALRDALRLKQYGEAHNIEWLTRSGWPADLPGQYQALCALAVMLNDAPGHGFENPAYLLRDLNPPPDKGIGRMLMTVYPEAAVTHNIPRPDLVPRVVNDLAYAYGPNSLGAATQPAIEAYLATLPPQERIPVPADIRSERRPAHIDYFPEAATVFTTAQPWLADHFLPLATFDLASLDPALGDVRLHLVKPLEPYEGYIGMETTAAHTDYCGTNWIAFHLEDDGTYRFLADKNYFLSDNDDPEAEAYFTEMRDSYAARKQHYCDSGFLGDVDDTGLPSFGEEPEYLPYLGGGNWTSEAPPPAFTMTDSADSAVDIRYQNHRFTCIAMTAGYDWGEGGADAMILLYEPVNRIALMTFDYT